MTIKNNIQYIAPNDFIEHELHSKFFLEQSKKQKKSSYHDSISRYGKIKQVVYIETNGQKQVIDGWGYVLYAIENCIVEIAAQCLAVKDEEDITQIMLELQFSDHSTPQEEFKMYNAAFDILSKGKGYRSDLSGIDNSVKPDENQKKRESIYDKIAAMTNATSGSRVKQILKIGKVNPEFFKLIADDRQSVYSVYLSCTAGDDNTGPKPPKVKSPVFTSNSTTIPQFEIPDTTDLLIKNKVDNYYDIKIDEDIIATITDQYCNKASIETENQDIEDVVIDDILKYNITGEESKSDYITLSGYCENCNKLTSIKIHINELAKQWNNQN